MYTNLRGLINHFNQIEAIADMKKPHFIILSETHLTDNVDESESVARIVPNGNIIEFNENRGNNYVQ